MNTNRTSFWGLVAVLMAACVFGGGCALRHTGGIVPISGLEDVPAGAVAVDVQNRRGSVEVVVDTLISHPVVRAVAREGGQAATWTAATMSTENGRPVLRVLSAPEGSGQAPWVDVVVRVPECGGVRVRTDEGKVTLTDVSGAIDARTRLSSGGVKAIVLSTWYALAEPVLLQCDSGDIDVRMGRRSAGRITATASGGVSVDASAAKLENTQSTRKAWTAVLNGGDSDMKFVADDGSISIVVGR